ncbi:hypothetical protein [Cognatishimia activa]|uniref:Uncharacterized protein n=1 Tax=Cognatishimia activa TaxID=1715691 RepID=A0A0P1IV17_9RHOB|nr:hypothetical protein [Cognatishimia activa]CUI51989.1 hypothetical protein TA5113_00682 [Cognatishimia activa]CUK27311.1 hypothetical protein TA5114_03139 [Cognatishimia activa]
MLRTLLVTLSLAGPSFAQDVAECDWQARADAIAEPWEENTRTFANGDVRLALLDTIEPAAAAYHILVLSPPYDELGTRQCRTVGLDGAGFSGIGFESLLADYDPEIGLIFGLRVQYLDGATSDFVKGDLVFTLNQATGDIEAFLE